MKINHRFEFSEEIDLYGTLDREYLKVEDPEYFRYRLSGMVIHRGTAKNGHIWSLIKVGNQWYKVDDDHPIENLSFKEVQYMAFGDQRTNVDDQTTATMLFYQRSVNFDENDQRMSNSPSASSTESSYIFN